MISKNSFKKIKSLKQKKFREESQRLIVEGVRSIESIINDGALIESVVYTQEFQSKNSDFISRFNNELLNEITEKEMNQLSLKRTFVSASINSSSKKTYLVEESFKGLAKKHKDSLLIFSYKIANDSVLIKPYNETQ